MDFDHLYLGIYDARHPAAKKTNKIKASANEMDLCVHAKWIALHLQRCGRQCLKHFQPLLPELRCLMLIVNTF